MHGVSVPVDGLRGRATSLQVSRAEQDGELVSGEILRDLQADSLVCSGDQGDVRIGHSDVPLVGGQALRQQRSAMPDNLSTNPMAHQQKVSFPNRRAAAARNRDRILTAARVAFADPEAEISMAEIARRAGVGMATLYRNFPGRRELLEAVYIDEIDAVCDAALTIQADTPGAAFVAWLRLVLAFVPNKRAIVSQLLEHTDHDDQLLHDQPRPSTRRRPTAAGRRTARR